jgi:hypothetical protein
MIAIRFDRFVDETPNQTAPAAAAAPPPLLPDPSAEAAPAGDAMTAIYSVLARLRTLDVTSGEQGVATNEARRNKALADELAAFARERANEAGSGQGLLGSIGHFVSQIAGDLLRCDVAKALNDAGNDIADAWNSPKFWSDVESGLAHLSVVADGFIEIGQRVGGDVGSIAASVSTDVSEAITLPGVLAHTRGQLFAAAATDARADAAGAKNDVDALERVASFLLDDIKQNDQSHAHAMDSVRGAILTNDKTIATASASVLRG